MTHRQRKARRRHRRRQKRNGPLTALTVMGGAVAVAAVLVLGYIAAVAATAPDISKLKPRDTGQSSRILAADGSLLGYVQAELVRTPVRWRDMPHSIRDAVVAIEDENFYDHRGVDFGAIVRAGFKNLESGKTVQGGSTITQQLVRSLYIDDPKRSFDRKIREAKLASEFESRHKGREGKQVILRAYLNSIPFGTVNGRTAVGVEAASQVFFSKRSRDLTLRESALLAGLPQAPSQYNPFTSPGKALARRNDVLDAMARNNYITTATAERTKRKGLGLNRGDKYTRKREPYFFDFVESQLIERYGVGVYRKGGLTIHTTIDPRLQEAGRTAINSQLNLPQDPSSAVVAIDPKNGYIRAMASSGTYEDRSFNLAAQGHRQPGSAFKTMVLTTAVRKGVDPRRTTYTSRPLNLNVPGYGPWKVSTYDDSYGGRMDLVKATLKSDNTVYAQLDVDLGPKEVRKTAKLMGIETKLDGIPSEGLGGLRLGVSPLEMANAYATLASGGMRNKPIAITKVEFADGKTEQVGKPKRKRVLPDWVTAEVTKILKQNVQSGTGTAASIGCPAAGKTGTTDNFNDAWFVGYTPEMSAAVWVGYPNALQEMRSVHGIAVAGGTFPARIWNGFMSKAKRGCKDFPGPSTPPQFKPFLARNSTTATGQDRDYSYQSGGYQADNTTGGNRLEGGTGGGGTGGGTQRQGGTQPQGGTDGQTGGGRNYEGYDPRLYESPPQGSPRGGGGRGGGQRGGGGQGGGGDTPDL